MSNQNLTSQKERITLQLHKIYNNQILFKIIKYREKKASITFLIKTVNILKFKRPIIALNYSNLSKSSTEVFERKASVFLHRLVCSFSILRSRVLFQFFMFLSPPCCPLLLLSGLVLFSAETHTTASLTHNLRCGLVLRSRYHCYCFLFFCVFYSSLSILLLLTLLFLRISVLPWPWRQHRT